MIGIDPMRVENSMGIHTKRFLSILDRNKNSDLLTMALLWRYLLKNYSKVLTLCIASFIAALLAMRFQSIARLASFSQSPWLIAQFVGCQIPYILPLAIPIASFIAALLLIQHLCKTHQLTALRAAGLGLGHIYSPILCAALALSFFTFILTSEITPRCRLYAQELTYKAVYSHPLLLIQKPKLLKLSNSYVSMKMDPTKESAKNFIFAIKDNSKEHLRLLTAQDIAVKEGHFIAKNIALISHLPAKDPSSFDHLLIESEEMMSVSAAQISHLLQKKQHKVDSDHLPLNQLIQAFHTLPFGKVRFELQRRVYFSCATFLFTFLGLSLGLQIGRAQRRRVLFWALFLPTLSLVGSVAAKSLASSFPLSLLAAFLPLVLITLFSLHLVKKASIGHT